MKKLFLSTIILVAIAASAFTVLNEWKTDDKASIKWEISNHSGTFSNLVAKIDFDKTKLAEAKMSATVDAKTLTACLLYTSGT